MKPEGPCGGRWVLRTSHCWAGALFWPWPAQGKCLKKDIFNHGLKVCEPQNSCDILFLKRHQSQPVLVLLIYRLSDRCFKSCAIQLRLVDYKE